MRRRPLEGASEAEVVVELKAPFGRRRRAALSLDPRTCLCATGVARITTQAVALRDEAVALTSAVTSGRCARCCCECWDDRHHAKSLTAENVPHPRFQNPRLCHLNPLLVLKLQRPTTVGDNHDLPAASGQCFDNRYHSTCCTARMVVLGAIRRLRASLYRRRVVCYLLRRVAPNNGP